MAQVLQEPKSGHYWQEYHQQSRHALAKHMMYNTSKFVAQVNEINKWLVLFWTPQEKLDDVTIMGILESISPKDWCDKMRHQRFDCVAKGQTKFINFCNNLETLDPTK
eukprot:6905797-Ditylum_brightwellii.AAC.1